MAEPLPTRSNFTLSVVIPVYNERETILEILARVQAVDIRKEIVIVDDFSTDGTRELLRTLAPSTAKVIFHERNQGKGAALRTGFAHATGDVTVVQDADLEYNPQEYHALIAPIFENKADVVYGSRFMGGRPHRVLFFWHSVANGVLTLFSNMVTNLNLTDMETCYKVFRREVLKGLQLHQDRFGIEPELTARVAKGKWRIYEVSISYYGRTYEEGKKVNWKDGIKAVYYILRYNLFP
jgi:glycosyltransferase involved in cell wall biosynthesis